jgi:hypothetical protein
MFEPNTDEYRFLVNCWRCFILNRIDRKLEELNDDYSDLSPRERDYMLAYNNDYDYLCFEGFDLHYETFNTERAFDHENDCIALVDSPKEMLYILQYTQIKVEEEDAHEHFDTNDAVDIMNKFIYFLSRDMLINQDHDVFATICDFIDIYNEYRLERKIAAAIICKRTNGFDGNILATILSFMN